MKINELLRHVASLVETREIISHGTIRMLFSEQAVREIESAEGCDEVDTDTIGDDDLAAELSDLAEDGDQIAELHLADIAKLYDQFQGDDIANYLDSEKEDELRKLDALIDAARELV